MKISFSTRFRAKAKQVLGLFLATLLMGVVPFSSAVPGQFTDPLSGMQFETMAMANLSLMLSLSQRSVFYQSVPLRLSGNRGSAQAQGRGNETTAEADKAPAKGKTPPATPSPTSISYRATDFRPRRQQSIARQFAALASEPEQQAELLQLGEAIFSEIENNSDFRRNNLSYAVALAIGAAVGIERGVELDQEESEFLLKSVHELLTADPQLMRRPATELTKLYDTSLLFAGLMVTFHADAQQNRRRESEMAARRLAKAVLKAVGWPSEDAN